jgi:hypothetical protein
MGDKTFVEGMIVKRSEKAPEYVLCNLSIKVAELVPFLQQHESNGWVNIQCMVSKAGKHYAELDTWKPTQGDSARQGIAQAKAAVSPDAGFADLEDIPFSNYELKVHW